MLKLSCRGFRRSMVQWPVVTSTKSRTYGTIETNNDTEGSSSLSSGRTFAAHGNRRVTMVTTTRGTPSTSVDLKEAMREKIPLHYDLLRALRSQHGQSVINEITVNDVYEGLKNVNALVRETTEFDSRLGVRYRGLTLPEVLAVLPRRGNAPIPEAVFWLLLTGDVPTEEQTASLVSDWTLRRQRRKNWWLDSRDDSFVGAVIRALPKNVSPLGRLSIALTALDASDKNVKDTSGRKSMNYDRWEQTYEEGMELLATLPAIVGLAKNIGNDIKGNLKEDGDWADFFLDRSGLLSDTIDGERRASFGDFLRLYIAANADEEGGTPSTHVTQILGATCMELNKTLASGVLAYSNEPYTGTMHECIDFQTKIQNLIGREPSEESLRGLIRTFCEKDNEVVGHKQALVCDSRYIVFSDFAREHLTENPDIKLSREISRILTSISRSSEINLWPEQSVLTAPIFRFYGLKDMEFNQTLLWMSRALGTVASIIWTRAIDVPVEHPKSRSTYTYLDYFCKVKKT